MENHSIKNILINRDIMVAIAIVIVQSIAAIFFVFDGVEDFITEFRDGIKLDDVMECIVAFALLAGVVLGARNTRKLMTEARSRDEALAVAKGAVGEIMQIRFKEWQLSAGEAEVALFAIKGCSASEIAEIRNAATGTVRSQLSQIYLKAGVTSQSMLISLFIEELV